MKLYFKRGVMSGFIITILIISALGVYAYVSIRKLIDGSAVQRRSLLITNYAERVLLTTIDLETGQRGYVVTGDSSYLEPYEAALLSVDRDLTTLENATASFPEKRALVDGLRKLVKQKTDIVSATIKTRSQSFEAAQAMVRKGDDKRVMDEIRVMIGKIRVAEEQLFAAETLAAEKRLTLNQYVFSVSLLIPFCIIIFLFYAINTTLNRTEQANERLSKANQDITKLNQELESFTYSVSHDLRAPLRSVNGYANVLMEDYGDVLDDEGRRTVTVIAKNGRRMGDLIDDLLNFSRLGRKELQRAPLSMNTMVNIVLEEIRGTDHINPNTKIEIKNLPDAVGDNSMMRQVWHNLISNALKYSGKTENPAVEIGSFFRDNDVCYYVKDNGVGFNMAYVNKLFGIFQRLHRNEEFEGTGVGLALTKRIIDRHEGSVWAEGALNAGATFYFSLPR